MADFRPDDVGVLNIRDVGDTVIELSIWNIADQAPDSITGNPGVDLVNTIDATLRGRDGQDTSVVGFDTYFFDATRTDIANYATAVPTKDPLRIHAIYTAGAYGLDYTFEAEHYIKISAGDGGNGIIGRGGAGGFLGGNLSQYTLEDGQGVDTKTLFGSLDITLPQNLAFDGTVVISGGRGGDGFTVGGVGGGVFGTNVHFDTNAARFGTLTTLRAGDGGFGVSGAGGAGGSLVGNSLERGVLLEAGDGGPGKVGGNGGSIVGHGNPLFADNRELYQVLKAGNGGNGITAGGNGGGISNYHGLFDLGFLGDSGGVISYVAGDAGNSVSGRGGNGGSVLNTSPFKFNVDDNLMSGDIYLRGGNGGKGVTGGRGGDVVGFVNQPTSQDSPAVLSFLGGSGGNGTKGAGGRGGDVRDITTPSKGSKNEGDAPLIDGVPIGSEAGLVLSTRATVYDYNRIIAGPGGLSSGGAGGDGGNVGTIISGNADGPFVVAAGAAGSGLTSGGRGGSVNTIRLDIGATSLAKAIVIAGAGGDAGAFVVNPLDPSANQGQKAFGGKVGRGGDGGSIANLTQTGGIASRVDLIAGNGGDTINYGTVADKVSFVGKGGSISNINLDGNIGNIDPTVPIKSYNNLKLGQTIADFVEERLRDRFVAGFVGDNVGNVGAVVGGSGRIKGVFSSFDAQGQPVYESLPAVNGSNGELINVNARNIMSAVAGSVERVAAIRSIQKVTVITGGDAGTDKTSLPFDYVDKLGNPLSEPVPDGGLVDGAIISSTEPTGSSFPRNNTFVLS